MDLHTIGAHRFKRSHHAPRILRTVNGDRNRRISWVRAINNRPTGDNLRTEYVAARNLFPGAKHLRCDSAHVADAEDAVRKEHIEFTYSGFALKVLMHVPK